ncbi:DUF724 domain-containing protein 5-like [Ziziphus jujuba]|uniref:DUF724 domain-containing protein 5-like n=1 Tax=Ziziphus jujuba TaxID=326968 RepID=A0ABM3ICF0_ZIZJJ|nr:DUF724 domain-containing protein 5-like [Ziziphus jujuba]
MTALIEVSGDQLDRAAGVGNCRTDKSELTVGVSGSEEALRDGTALVSATDCLAEEAMLVVSNNKPLSMYINEICSIENANYSGSTGDIEQNNGLSLPFAKTFSIWQQFESMEVFRKLPQNPHFQPLMKSKRLCREGLAIGNMFTFVFLVEMIAKLEIDAPAELVNDATEALVELEKMGFNVKALRGHLNELQLIQAKLRQLQDDSEEVKTKITYSTRKRTNVNEEVYELCKEMKKLVEKKARLITESVAISTELDMWQSVDADIMEDISRMKQNFLVLRRV